MSRLLPWLGVWLFLMAEVRAQTPAARVQRLNRRMSAIVLPAVEFRATPLGAAVEYLRQESGRLDPSEGGINILLPPGAADVSRAPISLNLSRIPLPQALRYVASQAGLKVRVEPYAVSLVPLSDPDAPLVNAVLSVRPGLFGPAPATH